VPKNPREWAERIHDAYPIEAREQRLEGVVGLTVTVGRDGRAWNCEVTQSSGHAILDAAACTGIQRYARFDPALDRNGNPIASTFSTRITYRL
jgi:protein TonB